MEFHEIMRLINDQLLALTASEEMLMKALLVAGEDYEAEYAAIHRETELPSLRCVIATRQT